MDPPRGPNNLERNIESTIELQQCTIKWTVSFMALADLVA